ncbi:MAG: iron-containing redox enzyme family protein, partial [Acidiferrobacterales bacterium]
MALPSRIVDYATACSGEAIKQTPFYRPIGWPSAELPSDEETGLHLDPTSATDALTIGRLLMASYENEFIFLPDEPSRIDMNAWKQHYAPQKIYGAHVVRHHFEKDYFAPFRGAIEVTGVWTQTTLKDYFRAYKENLTCEDTRQIAERIKVSHFPEETARFHAIQLAADFLVESSAMVRNLQGYYGPQQSELFKIVIDEFGYGVHETKHSTLYKSFLESIGLRSEPHDYWWWYLPSTIFANNYYNLICNNHTYFFNYIGAITQIENAFVISFQYPKELFESVFSGRADTRYFAEHMHIDQHHGRMAADNLMFAMAERFGDTLIPEFIRGFEESIYLGALYKADLLRQLDWVDALGSELKIADEENLRLETTLVDSTSVI